MKYFLYERFIGKADEKVDDTFYSLEEAKETALIAIGRDPYCEGYDVYDDAGLFIGTMYKDPASNPENNGTRWREKRWH